VLVNHGRHLLADDDFEQVAAEGGVVLTLRLFGGDPGGEVHGGLCVPGRSAGAGCDDLALAVSNAGPIPASSGFKLSRSHWGWPGSGRETLIPRCMLVRFLPDRGQGGFEYVIVLQGCVGSSPFTSRGTPPEGGQAAVGELGSGFGQGFRC